MPVHPIEAPILADKHIIGMPAMRVSAGLPSPAGDDLEEEIDPIAWVVRHLPQFAMRSFTLFVAATIVLMMQSQWSSTFAESSHWVEFAPNSALQESLFAALKPKATFDRLVNDSLF